MVDTYIDDELNARRLGAWNRTASRIVRAARSAKETVSMASPPTVTVGAAGAVSTIRGTAAAAPGITAAQLVAGGARQIHGFHQVASGIYTAGYISSQSYGSPTVVGAMGWGYEFAYDGASIDFSINGHASLASFGYRIYVDEGRGYELVEAPAGTPASVNGDFPVPSTTASNVHYVKVTFAAARARNYRILFGYGIQWRGINIEAIARVSAPKGPKRPRIHFTLDSYGVQSSGVSDYIDGSFVHRMGAALGCEVISAAVSGTGLVKRVTSFSELNFLERMQLDVVKPAWDDVDVWAFTNGSVNDNAQTAADIQANSTAIIQTIRSARPNALILAVGPFTAPSLTMSSDRAAAALAGFNAAADAGCILVNPYAENWCTGTGSTAAPTGTGTADRVMRTDKVHPNQFGCDVYGWNAAAGFVSGCEALAA